MTRPKTVLIVIVLAMVFAGAAAWLTYSFLQKEMRRAKSIQPQNVVVAAADIPIGGTIAANQVKAASWPRESIPPGSTKDMNAVVGRVAIRTITRGDAVSEQKLKPKDGTGSGFMTYVVPKGHRAVTVAVNEVAGVAGFLTPNDRVDVVVTTLIPGTEKENISKIILQNIPILATGQITDQKEGKPVVVPTVTLDITPEDSEKLVLAASKGSLQLLLRNITDTVPIDSNGATIYKVLNGVERPSTKAAPRPQKSPVRIVKTSPSPPPSFVVEIIKGKERSSKQFAEFAIAQ